MYSNVGWSSYTNKIDMLEKAYNNSLFIVTAWNNEELVGTIRVVGDGASIIYIQDIIVKTEHQKKMIGTSLLKIVLEKYENVYQKVLLTENKPSTVAFYESAGLKTAEKIGYIAFVDHKM